MNNPLHCPTPLPRRFADDASLRDNAAVGRYLGEHGLQDSMDKRNVHWVGVRDRVSEINQLTFETPTGNFFLPKIRGKVISEFSIFLMVLYALSIFVRYNRHVWLPMAEDQTDEHFLIRTFILLAKNQVPQMALNHLTRESWKFKPRE